MIRVSIEMLNQVSAKSVGLENIVQSMILLPASPVQRDKPHLSTHPRVPMNVLIRILLFLTYSGEEIAS